MKVIFLFLFILSFQIVKCQDLFIKITELSKHKDSITFTVTLENISKKTLLLFKPDINYVNYGLVAINLIEHSNNVVSHYNYGKKGDLDKLKIKENEFIILNEKESFSKKIQLSIANFLPFFKKSFYNLQFILDYSFLNLEIPCNMLTPIFKGKASTISFNKLDLK